MAGMPKEQETSGDIGGAGQFFKQVEGWLNDRDPQRRSNNRAAARGRVANGFAGVTNNTLAPVGGFNHFNRHWRKMLSVQGNPPPGDAPWWPNISPTWINQQMGAAFFDALAPEYNALKIRLRWTCDEPNLNADNTAFWARASLTPSTVWVDIKSPRAPGAVPDPMSNQQNWGFNAVSRLEPGALGPLTGLGDLDTPTCYDGIVGFDSSFDNDLGAVNENNGFRESWTFFPIKDPVSNAGQDLVGLRYSRDSWRRAGSEEETMFSEELLHSETGYLLWDERSSQAYRVIAMPRGVTVLAVARGVDANSTELQFDTDPTEEDPLGSGILSNPLLAKSVRTTRFTSALSIVDDGACFSYEDTAVQQREDTEEPIIHTDRNSLNRV